ncbi:MAG: putative bifunctional diguanylate cyclase/phosphodiesterase [Acidimicrobiia bacterium]
MKKARSVVRDRVVLVAIVALVAFATAVSVTIFRGSAVRTADEQLVAAARAQIERAHLVATAALQFEDDPTRSGAALEATLSSLIAAHNSLAPAAGDPGLDGIASTETVALRESVQPALVRLQETSGALLAGASASAGEATVTAALDFRTEMAAVARAFSIRAGEHALGARQMQLGFVAAGFGLAIFVLMAVANRATRAATGRKALRLGELDHLTGLVRRHALREHLIDAIHRRHELDGFVALVLLDVFPESPRPIGRGKHDIDRDLREVGRRLQSAVRTTDLVARTGGTQFAVAVDRSPRVEDAGRIAAKLLDVLEAPGPDGAAPLSLRAAAGIAVYPLDAGSGDELIEKAEGAARTARRRGGGYRYFSAELTAPETTNAQLARSLKGALREPDDQLWIAYQPRIRLRDRAVVGLEALVRWRHPELGALKPEEFIPVAEQSDLILDLGSWVIETVCDQLSAWSATHYPPLPVSVNVSTRQFRSGDLDQIVAAALARHDLPADLIEIEITEGVLMDDQDRPLSHMHDLRTLGVRIAVDDFGTGYSSLSYLKRLPIDTLKIDRSFISELRANSEDAAISTAIIALAHSLGLEVVAEGVETKEQLDILVDLGCDAAQGFYFSRPVPAAEAEELWRPRTAVG